MKTITNTIDCILIDGVKNIDPIRVMIEPDGLRAARLTVTCFGSAWTCYWPNLPVDEVDEFIITSGADYIAGCLTRGAWVKRNKVQEAYVIRIVEAIQAALRELQA